MKIFLIIGSLLGFCGVSLGAFGAHALKASLVASGRFDTFETAVRYQFYHALALVLVAVLVQMYPQVAAFRWAGWAFFVGTLIFSGALYAICFTGITVFGAIAPIGGLAMLLGWAFLAYGASRC